MLDRIASYLRKELETRGKVRAAMAYPGVMMVVAIGVTIFLLTYILPKFTPLFKSQGTQAAEADADHDGRSPTPCCTTGTSGWSAPWPLVGRLHLRPTDRAGPAGPRLAQDQPADRRAHVPQGDHQPQHPHAGHDARQRRADDRCHPPGRRGRRQLLLRAALARRARRSDRRQADLRGPPAATRCSPACWCR